MKYTALLVVAALAITLLVICSMLRRPTLQRISLRNITRRRWNTVLVVIGSMVGTALISGSLVLNDSTQYYQEHEARQTLGEIDEVVGKAGQRMTNDLRPNPLFDASAVAKITPEAVREASTGGEQSAAGLLGVLQNATIYVSNTLGMGEVPAGVDGVLGVLTGEVPAESLDDAGETVVVSPAVTVVGTDWEGLSYFGEEPPGVAARPEPGLGEVYASEALAKALELREGSRIRLVGRTGPEEFTVEEVVPEDGISGYEARFSNAEGTVLVNKEAARQLLGAGEGQINAIFVSNEGDVTSGIDASEKVAEAVGEVLSGEGELQVSQVKKDALEGGGVQISDIFLMLGSFTILAGVLLIVNIYTMLAEERKGELGILRAVALKRAGLVRLFVYEGYAYSLLSSLLGTFVGLGVAAGLVWGLNRATTTFVGLFNDDLSIPFHVKSSSLLVAASAGLLITFLAVFFASLRVGKLDIVAAIRDLPEEKTPHHLRRQLVLQGSLLALGLVLTAAGFLMGRGYLPLPEPILTLGGYPLLLGPILAAFGLGFLLSRFLPIRLVWTVVGAGVLSYAYFANGFNVVAQANEDSPAMFFFEGILMVLGAVLIATFNLGLVYGALRLVMRLAPTIAPVLKMAVAYPASRPARTSFTLAMFALILYMVTVSSIFSSTQSAASERTRDEQLSGYDGAVEFGSIAPVGDFNAKVDENDVLQSAITGSDRLIVGGVELPSYEAADYDVTPLGPSTGEAAPGASLEEYVTYVPDGFLESTTDVLEERSSKYATDREAWEALAEDPNLAILTFPYNGTDNFLARPELGVEDTLLLRDPVSGEEVEKKIVGRIKNPHGNAGSRLASIGVKGVLVGEESIGELPNLQTQDTYLLRVDRRADTTAVGRELKKEFATSGAQTFLLDDILGRGQQFTDTFVKIVQAFLAFGLVVGVAGLAVISARAVHERRHEIGALRAVGLKKGMIGWQFVVESSFIVLLGILLGIAVGALGGYNLFRFTIDNPDAQFVFPWTQMFVIGLSVWAASLVFTIVPAVRASRVPPVEALRHEG